MTTLTVKQAAQHAHVSRSLIYSLLRQGKLTASRIGCRGKGTWRIDATALEEYLAACRVEVKASVPLRHLR